MPIRDVAMCIVIFSLLPVCFFRPWIGILVWCWIGLMNPHRLTWGFSQSIPFALMVALATMAGMLLFRDDERRPIPWFRETRLLFVLWIVYTVTTLNALYPHDAWPAWEKVSKVLL